MSRSMPWDPSSTLESVFYRYLYGDWDSLNRWVWVYLHVSILVTTALVGYTFARGAYLLSLLLVPIPLFYLYRRYTYARPPAD